MLTTNNKATFEKVKLLIAHGIDKRLKTHFGTESPHYQDIILDYQIT